MNEITQELEAFLDTKGSIFTFNKGRIALYAILKALGIGPGDEVILPAYTCVVVPNAIIYLGATPIYIDIDLSTYSTNPMAIEKAFTSRTKAVLCQNTYGLSAGVDEIVSLCRSRNIFTIEDCAHGFGGEFKGRKNGTWCDAAFFSSQWNKPFSTGLGGYALINDVRLKEKVSKLVSSLSSPSLRFQAILWALLKARQLIGSANYYRIIELYRFLSRHNILIGSSSGEELESPAMPANYFVGMSKLQKRTASHALRALSATNEKRKKNGIRYTSVLADLGKNHVHQRLISDHLFLKYPLLVHDRNVFVQRARKAKIPLGDWFCSPLHPIESNLERWSFYSALYPKAVFASSHVVNLPTDEDNIEKILCFIKENNSLIMGIDDPLIHC
jgi:dTDP-4-amino-4,6-dideoxygalactose transaminase